MTREMLTVDADGHVLEPADTWQRYIDPKFRDRALRVDIDADGFENLFIDNRPTLMLKGRLGALGGIEAETPQEKLAFQIPGQRTYRDGAPPGGYDPHARLAVMDAEGIDRVLLYPTIGIAWEGGVSDPELALAYSRAYNRWIVDFCRTDPKRLYPIAHITLLNPEGAVEEVQRARRDGCVGVYLSPDRTARRGKALDDPAFDRFWATVVRLAHADRVPRRRARGHDLRAVGAGPHRRRRRVHVRFPRRRGDGRVHADDGDGPVREVPEAPVRRARGGLELDHGLARPPRPQGRARRLPDDAEAAAERVLPAPVRDLGRPRRDADRARRRRTSATTT